MPLFWTSACPDSLYTVAYIDMKSAFLIVDIAKDHSTICVEGDLIEFDSNLCSDGSIMFTAKTAAQSSRRGIVCSGCGASLALPVMNPIWQLPSESTVLR